MLPDTPFGSSVTSDASLPLPLLSCATVPLPSLNDSASASPVCGPLNAVFQFDATWLPVSATDHTRASSIAPW